MRLTDVENNAVNLLGAMPERTPALVRLTLTTLLGLDATLKAEVTEEMLEDAARRIEAQLYIRMEDAAAVQLKFEEWLPGRRADAPHFYYPRYRNWLGGRGFPPSVLGVMDKDTDKIVGLLENPLKGGNWKRRGLVVGHVQSGKTANYSGVICKASDYGYRFVVVLTGTQEDLRAQTQERIEEGFIGVSSEATRAHEARVGVGLAGLQRRPLTLTSRDVDFRSAYVNLAVPLQSLSEPLVLVMKKNASVLKNLIEWLKTKSFEGDGAKISAMPMLLIDDEADNASVNTSLDPGAPKRINALIRALLDLFDRNVYLGYTATPFANIFIDPDATDSLKREDLFPRDFIVALDAPTNYVGPSSIFPEDGRLHGCLCYVEDHEDILPERHKITLDPRRLPPSLEEAIRVYVLGRAVRAIRGQGTNHSSMLINVSRFNDVQTRVTGLVNDQLNTIRNACIGHGALPEPEAVKDPEIARLKQVWNTRLNDLEEDWEEVLAQLPKVVGPIEVRKINSKSSDVLDYRRYKDTGLHVIAVGGLALSRGFTLEGLSVSYFLRNSMMYDTLLQMGRWFGYRDGYADLCRIYMTPAAESWYAHISEAIEELRFEFKRMERLHKRPEDFGLRVRSHPSALIVTARNKMRSGRKVPHAVALGGRSIETTQLRTDSQEENFRALDRLVAQLEADRPHVSENGSGNKLWRKVAVERVRDFVKAFRNHDEISLETQSDPVLSYIEANPERLQQWDVCLYGRRTAHSDAGEQTVGGVRIFRQLRGGTFDDRGGYISVSGRSARIAAPGDEKEGMMGDEIRSAEEEFRSSSSNEGKSIPDRVYRQRRSKPLLMLRLLHVEEMKPEDGKKARVCEDMVAWGMSFPPAGAQERTVEYIVNTTWWRSNFEEELEDDTEDLEAFDD
ncbi:Z1 domain-containing protein [Thiomonas sp. FB-Cd]|uniref:Z1 domain-containing protein n=1 Tax=Thiomonas sp. FB-Cd TaxID=1158292 RepID=UPI00056EBE80|nr:Z1 domain-containing protein [Thiomonas sp. FB-Cd]